MTAYEKWKSGRLKKNEQTEIDRFARATGADAEERAFRTGWKAYEMMSPKFERFGEKKDE